MPTAQQGRPLAHVLLNLSIPFAAARVRLVRERYGVLHDSTRPLVKEDGPRSAVARRGGDSRDDDTGESGGQPDGRD